MVLLGLVLLLGDLIIIAGLVCAVVMSARRLRPSQLARAGASASKRWVDLIAALALLGLVVFGNVWFLISSYDDGRPSLAQVTGTWTNSAEGGTATLRIFPDGTFTATGLPPDTDSATSTHIVPALPADEHGTWRMVPRNDGGWWLLCSLSSGPQFNFEIFLVQPEDAAFTYAQGQSRPYTVWGFDRSLPTASGVPPGEPTQNRGKA